VIADDIHDHDADTFVIRLRRRVDLRLDDDDDGRIGRRFQVVGQLADAARDQDPDVRLPIERRCRLRLTNLSGELLVTEGERQLDHAGGTSQPPHVAVEEKRPAVIGAHRFVDALAVQKAVIKDGDHRLALRGDTPIDVDRCGHM